MLYEKRESLETTFSLLWLAIFLQTLELIFDRKLEG